jgi:hypothetical protein
VNFKAVKRMFRFGVPLISVCALLALTGCNHNSTISGKYVDEKQPQNYFELKKDGMFSIHQGDVSKNGKYVLDGNKVTLTLDGGGVAHGKIEGKTFIDNGGVVFTLK